MSEGKIDTEQQKQISRRVDVVSFALLAEINHFHAEQSAELNRVFREFLAKQIEFHQNVSHGPCIARRFSIVFRIY